MATHNKTSDGPHSIWEQMQFRMLFVMVSRGSCSQQY